MEFNYNNQAFTGNLTARISYRSECFSHVWKVHQGAFIRLKITLWWTAYRCVWFQFKFRKVLLNNNFFPQLKSRIYLYEKALFCDSHVRFLHSLWPFQVWTSLWADSLSLPRGRSLTVNTGKVAQLKTILCMWVNVGKAVLSKTNYS